MKIWKVLRTVIASILIVLILAVAVGINVIVPQFGTMVKNMLGYSVKASNPADVTGVDLAYNTTAYTRESIKEAETALNNQIVGEGLVLLKNEGYMPYAEGTAFSFFGQGAANLSGGGLFGMGASSATLKSSFEQAGFAVNDTLWKFYTEGKGKGYGLGPGSVGFGDSEDFSINECPASVLQSEAGLEDTFAGTTAVYVWGRKAGEGRDLPRSMYNHTDIPEDKTRSYLEPNSTELELLSYLNENFDDVTIIVNATAAMELGWVENFENIHAILFVPSLGSNGMEALAGIFSGKVNPSGKTVDTFAFDAMSAPAAQNYGDYQYVDENGQLTKYNYISYLEGIYVGYKYYETRYEDAVLGQGNAGNYDYASQVLYPFGYGLSYTSFDWKNYQTSWSGTTCTVTVDVTNTGAVAGKDVVQIYAQAPYTEYDKANLVEKASVNLVGYAKTNLLQPGETQSVTVTFDREQLKSYDYKNAKTYILDAGEYYITAGTDAHAAVNNILAHKGAAVDGSAALVGIYTPDLADVDKVTYSIDMHTGTAVTNQFDFAGGGLTYLSRQDWQGTWPEHDGQVSASISTWGNEINGTDPSGNPASFLYTKTISAEDLAQCDSFDSLNPTDSATLTDTPVYNARNGVLLSDLRGKDYDDPLWEDLLDNLTPADYQKAITLSGYEVSAIKSVGMPTSMDADTASGLIYGGTGAMYMGMLVLAQTWSPELAETYGEMIGDEAILGGATGWYAPSMNIHRLPFSGRNNEYYSEDGFLSGVVGAASSRGAASRGMNVYIKHFAVNDQENHRGDRDGQFGLVTWSNEQALREIYLKPFEMCVKNDPITLKYVESDGAGGYKNATREIQPINAIMTAFNRIGYTWTGGAYPLITGVLRNEWGFRGFALTDNANTGLFIDAGQMIEAGADAKLTNLPASARWTFDETSSSDYHYGREAMHHLLYAVANSKAMNGVAPGGTVIEGMPTYQKILIAVDVVAVLLIAALVWFIIRGFRKKKKPAQVA